MCIYIEVFRKLNYLLNYTRLNTEPPISQGVHSCIYLKGNRLWVNVKCLTYLTVDQLGSHVKKYNIVYCLCMILRRIKDFLVAILQKLASAACISRGGQIKPSFCKPNLDGWFLMPFFLLNTNPMRSRVYCMPIRWFSGLF